MKNFKKYLIEFSNGGPGFAPDGYNDNPSEPNTGKIAGLGTGLAANTQAITQNSYVQPTNLYYSNNRGTLMGLGVDDDKFQQLKSMVSGNDGSGNNNSSSNFYYDENDSFMSPITDDPDSSDHISWQDLNLAVSTALSQDIKNLLTKHLLLRGDDKPGELLSPEYNPNSKIKFELK